MSQRHLDSLFRPKSIAFIGASQEPGRIGTVVTQNLLHGGFNGPIMPVTRRFKSVGGVLAYPNVAGLPMTPELAIIGTPPEPVPSLVRELGEQGTRAAIVLTTGMSRVADDLGGTAAEAMLEAARPYNLRILGPNSFGVLVPGRRPQRQLFPPPGPSRQDRLRLPVGGYVYGRPRLGARKGHRFLALHRVGRMCRCGICRGDRLSEHGAVHPGDIALHEQADPSARVHVGGPGGGAK